MDGENRALAATPDQPADSSGKAAPLGASPDRLASLDFIRGIAVLGIIFANIHAFGQPLIASMWPPAGMAPAASDDAFWLAQFVLVDGKMRGLFSVLFGAGMILFLEKAWSRGSGRWLQARRLGWLALFGLAHFFLLFRGDILFNYAICGLIAMAVARWDWKNLFWIGFGGYAIACGLYLLSLTFPMVAEQAGTIDEMRDNPMTAQMVTALEQQRDDLIADGAARDAAWDEGFSAAVRDTWTNQWQMVLKGPLNGLFETVPLMLMGMGLFKRGWFDPGASTSGRRRRGWIMVIGGTIATALLGWWVVSTGFGYFTTMFVAAAAGMVTRLPVVIGLVPLLTAWAPRAVESELGARFAAAGRMAFSNYLGTSIIMLAVFQGWALGLFGELTRGPLLAIAAATAAVMLLWSKPWLARYRFGPLEWLWRCLTYGKLFPLRRELGQP